MVPVRESIDETAELMEAIQGMVDSHAQSMLIMWEGKVVGILRLSDVFEVIAGIIRTGDVCDEDAGVE